jgi:O-antigen ligase
MTESASLNTAVKPQENLWLKRLHALENALALAYAISLPLSMTASWVILTAAIIVLAIDLLVSAPARKQLLSHAPLMVPMFVLTAAVAASGIENGGMSEAARFVYSLKALLAYFFASLCFSRYPRLSKNVLFALLGVGAVAGLWGTYQQIFNFHPFGYKWLQGTGFLAGPMAYAGQMQLLSMLALGLLFTGGYRQLPLFMSGRTVFALITAANVLGLIFAGERSAWLGGLAGVVAATALISWRKFLTAVVVLSVVGSLSYLFVPLVHTRVDGLLSARSDVSSQVRLTVWHRAIQEWQRSPLLGIGFLKFPPLNIPEATVPGHSRVIDHAHSNYFHLLATTGIFGLIAFAYLLFSILRHSRRLYLTGLRSAVPFLSGCGNGLFAATVSLAVAGLFEYNFGTAQVRLAQWFLLGLLGLLP